MVPHEVCEPEPHDPSSAYRRFAQDQLTLRDLLAVDRTIAANERTVLGYVRTTLALLVAGGSLLHFLDEAWATFVGILLLGAAVPMSIVGVHHYLVRRQALAPLMRHGVARGPAPDPSTTATATLVASVSAGDETASDP